MNKFSNHIDSGAQRWRRALWLPPLIVLTLYGVFILCRLAQFDFDPTVFINASEKFTPAPDDLPTPLMMQSGYDGYFMYRIAVAPFETGEVVHGMSMDQDHYRHQRIGYPLLVYGLSFGQPAMIPWMMILVNWIWVGLIALIIGVMLRHLDLSTLWAIFPALWCGLLISMNRDLSEVQQCGFIILTMMCHMKKRYWIAALALTAAILTRETSVLLIGAWGLAALLDAIKSRNMKPQLHIFWLVIPITGWAIWQAWIYQQYSAFGPQGHGHGSSIPLVDLFNAYAQMFQTYGLKSKKLIGAAIYLIILIGTLVMGYVSLNKKQLCGFPVITVLLLTALMLILPESVWRGGGESLNRTMSDLAVVALLLLFTSRFKKLKYMGATWVTGSLLLAAAHRLMIP